MNINTEQVALRGNTAHSRADPINVRLPEASRISGLSRSTLYRLNAERRLIFRKSGRAVLVDFPSLRSIIDAMPEVTTQIAPRVIAPAPAPRAKGSRTLSKGRRARAAAVANA